MLKAKQDTATQSKIALSPWHTSRKEGFWDVKLWHTSLAWGQKGLLDTQGEGSEINSSLQQDWILHFKREKELSWAEPDRMLGKGASTAQAPRCETLPFSGAFCPRKNGIYFGIINLCAKENWLEMAADMFYKLKSALDSRKERCWSRMIGLERSFECPAIASKQDIWSKRYTAHLH